MKFLNDIEDGSLLIATNQDKLKILSYLSDNSIFLNLVFFDASKPFSKISLNYPFYLNKYFKIKPYLSERLKKYYDYIDVSQKYDIEKIEKLKEIKKALIENQILIERANKYLKIYSVNDYFIPDFLVGESLNVYTSKISDNQVLLCETNNQNEQVMYVFEKICELLEKGIDLNRINILNSREEDDLLLTKLFKDAEIPYNINKSINLAEYPVMIELFKLLKKDGYETAKAFLRTCKSDEILNRIIRVFNSYNQKIIENDIDTFIFELKKLSFVELSYEHAISITNFNNDVYRKDEYYILMNYYDDFFPKTVLDNDYLSDEEAKVIKYPTSLELNLNTRKRVTNILHQIENLILVYPKEIIEETRPARLSLTRKIVKESYHYQAKEISYLNDFLLLDYAKKSYDFNNYNITSEDYIKLHNTLHGFLKKYIPYYTGIESNTLLELVKKNNTLTAYKLEAYNLCPFKYYLKYLLKLDSFEENIYTYIGSIIHKALELNIKQESFNMNTLFSQFTFPKAEAYKYEIFSEIIMENVSIITNIVKEFESNSNFKNIVSEEKIYQKFDDSFYLSGIIDKVMVDEETQYFLIIDYKYSDKDFKKEDLTKEYKLQLPFYLLSYQRAHPELKPAGILYQKTSLQKEERSSNSNYKLKGMIVDLVAIVNRIDPSFSKIQGVNLKKDGTLKENVNTIIPEEEFNTLIAETTKIVDKVSKKILQGNFEIKPILYDKSQRTNDSISCEYCNYSSICFSKNKLLGGE